ncbi:T9SS type A sorting domain-containing protein [Flavobacterium sharifuzzamanii]|uniref:T9SS type A sorting domain-containing protein n=1 Tax=Flavobacterium sharifuzzamanii TaxID=2211133 RepID=UPI000DAE0A2C|nr:T9SS type A sorting domain-containing protein [Flavobacterium sharifuzzamanii]KAF2080999.1 T9SS type A sorting domain-containing protein [Flavobacterium sharifuzzamanii]
MKIPHMKKLYFLILFFCFFNLNAQIITISDVTFKQTLLKADTANAIAQDSNGNSIKIDLNNNKEIEVSEALNVYKLNVYMPVREGIILSLSGIENFINLIDLNCSGFYNQTLDLTLLKNLEKLTCSGTHQMKELKISGLTKLKYLDTNNCVNLTSLDVSGLTNLEYLDCSRLGISSLNLSGLTKLIDLRCFSTVIANLDLTGLVSLKKVYCNESRLTALTLGTLDNLDFLDCSSNGLKALNLSGLKNLTYLRCSSNLITNLDFSPLTKLKTLLVQINSLTNLDVQKCLDLEYLDCSSNSFTSLNISNLPKLITLICKGDTFRPKLNSLTVSQCNSLASIDCSQNKLESLNLGVIPTLKTFSCTYNSSMTTLDTSGFENLESLNYEGSALLALDVSKSVHLKSIYGASAKIEFLDFSSLKELETLYLSYNDSLLYLLLKNGKTSSSYIIGAPKLKYLCVDDENIKYYQQLLGNPKNCEINTYCNFVSGKEYYVISGVNKYNFDNKGCVANNSIFPNLKYTITNGTNSGSFYPASNSSYAIPVQAGVTTIRPIIENPNYFTVSPASLTVNFPTQTSPYIQDFCISSNGNQPDLEMVLIPIDVARPGFDAKYKIVYRNKGNVTQSGVVNFTFNDDVLDLIVSSASVESRTRNTLSWNFTDFPPFATKEIILTFKVNRPTDTPAVNNGDVLKYKVSITSQNNDKTPLDNNFTLNQTVVGSYDPNDKTCLEGDIITPDLIGEYVHYMIRFENTGTYPAQNIVVKDMIDLTKFDISTLIPTSSSHSFITKISGGNKVEFIFENINLPFDDANNDGYIAFKIKTKPTLQVGDSFTNDANIYFDYNFPILTNKATSTFKTVLSTEDFNFSKYFSLYPNPANQFLNISQNQNIEVQSYEIYDVLGQLVLAVPNAKTASNIDISKLRVGNYFIRVKSDKGSSSMKFIKN